MKLIICSECYDCIKLSTKETRHCECGKAGGRYLEDGWHAEYWGDTAITIGFDNNSLASAIRADRDRHKSYEGLGALFQAFIIPKNCNTFIKIAKGDN